MPTTKFSLALLACKDVMPPSLSAAFISTACVVAWHSHLPLHPFLFRGKRLPSLRPGFSASTPLLPPFPKLASMSLRRGTHVILGRCCSQGFRVQSISECTAHREKMYYEDSHLGNDLTSLISPAGLKSIDYAELVLQLLVGRFISMPTL